MTCRDTTNAAKCLCIGHCWHQTTDPFVYQCCKCGIKKEESKYYTFNLDEKIGKNTFTGG